MPAPGCSTFDGNPNLAVPTTIGYRPGLPDFNGAACTDDPVHPPSPPQMATAACWNTCGAQHVSTGKMIACANVAVTAGASPTIASSKTAANKLASSPFTLTRNAAGNYSITWPVNTFPVSGWPKAYLNAVLGAHSYGISAVNITNGVQVYTTQDGALADLNFNVDIF